VVVEGVAPAVVEGVAPVAPPRNQGFPSTEVWRQTANCGPTVTLPSASGGPRASVASAPETACASLLPASPARPYLLQVGPTKFDPKIRIQSNQMQISMDDGDKASMGGRYRGTLTRIVSCVFGRPSPESTSMYQDALHFGQCMASS
jgi:hypothetical protein